MKFYKINALLTTLAALYGATCNAAENENKIDQPIFSAGLFSDYSKLITPKSDDPNERYSLTNFFNGVKLNYKISDDLTVDLKVGQFINQVKARVDGQKYKHKLPKMFAYGLGLRYRLFDDQKNSVFFEPSITRTRIKYKEKDQTNSGLGTLNVNESCTQGNIDILSARLIYEREMDNFIPYAGLQYKKNKIKGMEKDTHSVVNTSTGTTLFLHQEVDKFNLKINRKNLGAVLGFRYAVSDEATFKIESRLVNEKALCAEVSFKF